MSGPFGLEAFGEYFDEEPSTTEIPLGTFGPTSVGNSPVVQNLDIVLPFIAAATAVNSPALVDQPARLTHEPVEVLISPTSQTGRLSHEYVDVVLLPNPHGRITHEYVDVLVLPDQTEGLLTFQDVDVLILPNPQAWMTAEYVEALMIKQYDRVTILWGEER